MMFESSLRILRISDTSGCNPVTVGPEEGELEDYLKPMASSYCTIRSGFTNKQTNKRNQMRATKMYGMFHNTYSMSVFHVSHLDWWLW